MERKAISFRLRKIDDDLKRAIEGMSNDILSDLCRDGLRYMLGLKTTRRVEVTEHAIIIPQTKKTVETKSAVWKPKDKN